MFIVHTVHYISSAVAENLQNASYFLEMSCGKEPPKSINCHIIHVFIIINILSCFPSSLRMTVNRHILDYGDNVKF